jgi:hypothetical protein
MKGSRYEAEELKRSFPQREGAEGHNPSADLPTR